MPKVTDERVQEIYLEHLEEALKMHNKYWDDRDGEYPSFLTTCYRKCKLTWDTVNLAVFEWPKNYALHAKDLDFFAESSTVWGLPSVSVKNGKLIIEVLLVDYYNKTDVQRTPSTKMLL